MIGAVRSRMARRAAIPELRARRVAERPPAHGLFQLNDCDPDRHRKHDALNLLRLGIDNRLRLGGERGRAANHSCNRSGARRNDLTDGLLRRRRPRWRPRRARRLCAARKAQAVHLADHRVPGQPVSEQVCDLAGAFAFHPGLPELLHAFIRPRHCRLVRQDLCQKRGPRQNPASPPGDAARRAKRERLRLLMQSPRYLVALNAKTTLLVESCARVAQRPTPGFSTALRANAPFDLGVPPRLPESAQGVSVDGAQRTGGRTFSAHPRTFDQIRAFPLYMRWISGRPSGAAFLFCVPSRQLMRQTGTRSS